MKHTYEERRSFINTTVDRVANIAAQSNLYYIVVSAEAPEALGGELFNRVYYAEQFNDFVDLYDHMCFRYDTLGVKFWIDTNDEDRFKNGGLLDE